MSTIRLFAPNGDAYGEVMVRRAPRTLRRCIGQGCTALVRAPKVRCSPCQADHIDACRREQARRAAERRRAAGGGS